MTVSLALGGAGLGTAWGEQKALSMLRRGRVRRDRRAARRGRHLQHLLRRPQGLTRRVPARGACGLVVAADRAQLRAVVLALDDAHGARARAHDDRLGRRGVAAVAHALSMSPSVTPVAAKKHVVAADEVVAREHAVEVVAGVERRSRSSSSRGHSRPEIRPPRHDRGGRSTPSGVPPMPHSRSTPRARRGGDQRAATSPSVIRRMRAPASRMRASSRRGAGGRA